jgi:hypothetical protein
MSQHLEIDPIRFFRILLNDPQWAAKLTQAVAAGPLPKLIQSCGVGFQDGIQTILLVEGSTAKFARLVGRRLPTEDHRATTGNKLSPTELATLQQKLCPRVPPEVQQQIKSLRQK